MDRTAGEFRLGCGGGEEKKGPHFAGITFGNRETLKKSAFVSIQQIIYSICDGPGDV